MTICNKTQRWAIIVYCFNQYATYKLKPHGMEKHRLVGVINQLKLKTREFHALTRAAVVSGAFSVLLIRYVSGPIRVYAFLKLFNKPFPDWSKNRRERSIIE